MALFGRQYTVTAAAVAPLATADGSAINITAPTRPGHIQCQEIRFSAPAGNAASVFIGNSSVTTSANILVEVRKGTTEVLGPFPMGTLYADEFFVVGTANDILNILATPY
jgi:hypothetical protein